MKNLTKITIKGLAILFLATTMLTSCSKYKKYDNKEVIEDNYTGSVVMDNDSDPDGDFSGNGDNGTFSFAWANTGTKAFVKFDITATEGSVQLVLKDKRGKEVLNQTLTGGAGIDSFEGISEEGKTGTWKVSLTFTNFKGSGSFELDPAN